MLASIISVVSWFASSIRAPVLDLAFGLREISKASKTYWVMAVLVSLAIVLFLTFLFASIAISIDDMCYDMDELELQIAQATCYGYVAADITADLGLWFLFGSLLGGAYVGVIVTNLALKASVESLALLGTRETQILLASIGSASFLLAVILAKTMPASSTAALAIGILLILGITLFACVCRNFLRG